MSLTIKHRKAYFDDTYYLKAEKINRAIEQLISADIKDNKHYKKLKELANSPYVNYTA
jgi:hypothetical protein